MSAESTLPIVKGIVSELFSHLGIEETPLVSAKDDQTIAISLTLEDPKTFIGERGQTLFEIQHIVRAMLRKRVQDGPHVFLDINDYRKSKEEYLRDTARQTADEAVLLNKERELPAMPAAERRIVHMELAQRTDVVSESVGEGADRRIVIKPRAL
jgi:spoIIIJ-associated protein